MKVRFKAEDLKGNFEQTYELLSDVGFRTIDALERRPYVVVEYATRRAYVWFEKKCRKTII